MPLPTVETVRLAIQKAICEGLEASGGTWYAPAPGHEIGFRPGREISVLLCLDDEELEKLPEDQPAEKEYRFRLVLEAIE